MEVVRASGGWGAVVFALIYTAAAVFLLPASPLTLAAGALWGPAVGLAVVLPSSWLASAAAFGVGRFGARGWVAERVRRDRRLQALDQAVAAGGVRIVALLRLSPLVPFNLLNYVLGASRVTFRQYLVGSVVGMLPGTALYVWIGSLAAEAGGAVTGTASTTRLVATGVGVLATAVAAGWVARAARRALDASAPSADPSA